MSLTIYYDSLQEGVWFQQLHPLLQTATLSPFNGSLATTPELQQVLLYDRPDIVLYEDTKPILVLERTVEVPSGHNVGQRFPRLVAAAQKRIPVVYFGPYAAYKHGGQTQGPRYMNLRLFYALKAVAAIEETAVTIINWPVDGHFEIIQTPTKDTRLRKYLELFFSLYRTHGLPGMLRSLMTSTFEQEQEAERQTFVRKHVRQPHQYDGPPDSVRIGNAASLSELKGLGTIGVPHHEVVLYKVGMRYVRSDPYTGTAMLYAYLYCGGLKRPTRTLVLEFRDISKALWRTAAKRSGSKHIRLFKLVADGIVFSDGYLPKAAL